MLTSAGLDSNQMMAFLPKALELLRQYLPPEILEKVKGAHPAGCLRHRRPDSSRPICGPREREVLECRESWPPGSSHTSGLGDDRRSRRIPRSSPSFLMTGLRP